MQHNALYFLLITEFFLFAGKELSQASGTCGDPGSALVQRHAEEHGLP